MALSNKIIQLISHARESVDELANKHHNGGFWGDGLAGYCGVASRFLISLARRNGIHNMHLVCGSFNDKKYSSPSTHCWVIYGKFCIDITISQFDGFKDKKYRICTTDSVFYRTHYIPELAGAPAVRCQKQWEEGQNYEKHSPFLWQIHKHNYIREYNGLFLR